MPSKVIGSIGSKNIVGTQPIYCEPENHLESITSYSKNVRYHPEDKCIPLCKLAIITVWFNCRLSNYAGTPLIFRTQYWQVAQTINEGRLPYLALPPATTTKIY